MKDMLSEKDVRRLGVEVGKVLEDNIMPQLDVMHEGIAGLKKEMVSMKAVMVTKDYLDEKLGSVNGKINVLVDVLHRNGTISDDQRRIVHA
jgi:hypothetical protein